MIKNICVLLCLSGLLFDNLFADNLTIRKPIDESIQEKIDSSKKKYSQAVEKSRKAFDVGGYEFLGFDFLFRSTELQAITTTATGTAINTYKSNMATMPRIIGGEGLCLTDSYSIASRFYGDVGYTPLSGIIALHDFNVGLNLDFPFIFFQNDIVSFAGHVGLRADVAIYLQKNWRLAYLDMGVDVIGGINAVFVRRHGIELGLLIPPIKRVTLGGVLVPSAIAPDGYSYKFSTSSRKFNPAINIRYFYMF